MMTAAFTTNVSSTTRPDVAGPFDPADTELSADTFYVSQEMDSETLSAHQTCLSAEVRLQPKHNLRERKFFERKYARQADLLKERDVEIEYLKAQLSLKEAEATEAIHLRNQVFVVKALKAARVSKLNSLKEQNSALEEEKNTLEGKVMTPKSAATAKETELASLTAQTAKLTQDLSSLESSCDKLSVKVDSLKSERDGFADQVSLLKTTCFRLRNQVSGYELFKEHVRQFRMNRSRYDYRKDRRYLADVASYDPSVEASIADIISLLHLKGTSAKTLKKLKESVLSQCLSISDAMGVLADPLCSENLIGDASTSGVLVTTVTTKALAISVIAANISSIPPVSVADYDMADAGVHDTALHSPKIVFEKEDLEATPEHPLAKLHQLDIFYNALNSKDQDSLNFAAGGNFLDKIPRECLAIIESKSKVSYLRNKPVVAKVSMNTSSSGISPDVAELKDMMKALLLDKKGQNQAPAIVKAVEESCVTCGGAHSYHNCLATDGNIHHDNNQEFVSLASAVTTKEIPTYQAPAYQAPAPQTQGVLKEDFSAYVKANDALGTLPSNTIANPRSDLKAITTRSCVSYDEPQVPPPLYFLHKVVENEPEATKDTVHPTNNGSTEDVQLPVVQSESPILTSDPVKSPTIKRVTSPVSTLRPNKRHSIPYPSRIQDQKLRDQANEQCEKFFQIFKDLNFNISFADAFILMPKFGPSIKSLLTNKDKLCELARTPLNEHYSAVLLKKFLEKLRDPDKFLIRCDFPGKAECLALADLDASINLMPLSMWNKLSLLDLTHTCMTLELADRLISRPVGVAEDVYVKVEVDAFLALEDDPTSPKVDQSYLDSEGDILLLEAFLNDDPSLPPPNQGNYLPEVRKELKIREAKSNKSSIDEPQSFECGGEHRSYNSSKVTQDFELAVQHHKRVNPKIYDFIKQEVLKLLDAGLTYPIFDSPWVSPLHCVPKKGGFTVVENENNELIPTRLVTGWCVCIDYHKLNESTRKGHFPLSFMDQRLERLAGNQYYCFLNGFSGNFQISIDPKDQEKTTFTCPYGTFAYCRLPFRLCNAPDTFQRCMMTIFHDMIEKTMDVTLLFVKKTLGHNYGVSSKHS
nr:reverse transcriptase domain-containing protein [Tanacetum cinerariifolium]